jgi:hypothetical protein
MMSHTMISPQEAADRLAIRELVDAYAHCADRRDARGQMDLFTEGQWLFAERRLMVNWIDTRPSQVSLRACGRPVGFASTSMPRSS